jgi:hypothetical protein
LERVYVGPKLQDPSGSGALSKLRHWNPFSTIQVSAEPVSTNARKVSVPKVISAAKPCPNSKEVKVAVFLLLGRFASPSNAAALRELYPPPNFVRVKLRTFDEVVRGKGAREAARGEVETFAFTWRGARKAAATRKIVDPNILEKAPENQVIVYSTRFKMSKWSLQGVWNQNEDKALLQVSGTLYLNVLKCRSHHIQLLNSSLKSLKSLSLCLIQKLWNIERCDDQ